MRQDQRFLAVMREAEMKIQALKKHRNKNPNGYFADLSPLLRRSATNWLTRFLEQRRRNGQATPLWTFAILVGQAKRLAVNPPTSAWGRSMQAKRGGKAVQRKYRREGRHPTQAATLARYWKRKAGQRAKAEAERRERLGLGKAARVAYLPPL